MKTVKGRPLVRQFAAFLMLALFVSVAAAAAPRMAVMSLENKTAWRGENLGDGMADMLVSAFTNTKQFRMIERAEMDKILQEQNFALSGAVNAQTAAKVGQILGVEYMIIGSVNEFGTQESEVGAFGVNMINHTAAVGLDIRVINTTTAEIVAAATGQCSKSTKGVGISNADILPTNVKVGSDRFSTTLIGKATRGAVDDATAKIVKELGGSWKGAVVKVSEDGTVTINGGENAGVKVNDIFKVIRKGEEMVDPETGESLGSEDEVIGEIKITEVKPKYANAKVVKGSGIAKSDTIEKK